ncbi:hypothetical protein EV361DRAFT_918657 [Lentinula raphanica]|nr:hypothetical protein EV361DRAFT_918657 [Lentinula raphanica]
MLSKLLSWTFAIHGVIHSVFAQNDGNNASPSPPFFFESIATGVLTQGIVTEGTVGGSSTPPPFDVVFSQDGTSVTVGPFSSFLPISGDPQHKIFSLTIPTLGAATDSVEIFVEYLSPSGNFNTDPFPIGSDAVAAQTSESGSTSSMLTATGTTTTPPSPSPSLTLPTTTSFASGNPSQIRGEMKTKRTVQLSAIIGGSVGGGLFILFAILFWILYRYCHKKKKNQRLRKSRSSGAWATTSFHADRMVKNPGVQTILPAILKPATGIDGQSQLTSRSISRATSRNSSIDSTIEKYPALKSFQSRFGPPLAKGSGQYHDDETEPKARGNGVDGDNGDKDGDDGDGAGDTDGWSRLVSIGYRGTGGPGQSRSLAPPRTDRQMELEQRIHDLKAEMISLSLSHRESREGSMTLVESGDQESDEAASDGAHESSVIRWHHIRTKIRRLEALEFSDWALGVTDRVPKELVQS